MSRNHLLEHLEGPRTYIPAPNHVIVELVRLEKTKFGLLLPDGGGVDTDGGEKLRPVGIVKALGPVKGEEWNDLGPPCDVGDTVLFHPNVLPIVRVEGDMYTFQWDMIYLVVVKGQDGRGVYVCPTEAGNNGGVEVMQ